MLRAIVHSVWRSFWPLRKFQHCPRPQPPTHRICLLVTFSSSQSQTSCDVKRTYFELVTDILKLCDKSNSELSSQNLPEVLLSVADKTMSMLCTRWENGHWRNHLFKSRLHKVAGMQRLRQRWLRKIKEEITYNWKPECNRNTVRSVPEPIMIKNGSTDTLDVT